MYRLSVIAVGKLKEEHWRDAQDLYARRLAPYAKLDVVEVEAEAFGRSVTAERAMATEAERLAKRIPAGAFTIALDRRGKPLDSQAFAGAIADAGRNGRHVALLIGGAAGIDPALLGRADARISFSPLTFTHEMARVILLEQLYRAMTILTGKAYHY